MADIPPTQGTLKREHSPENQNTLTGESSGLGPRLAYRHEEAEQGNMLFVPPAPERSPKRPQLGRASSEETLVEGAGNGLSNADRVPGLWIEREFYSWAQFRRDLAASARAEREQMQQQQQQPSTLPEATPSEPREPEPMPAGSFESMPSEPREPEPMPAGSLESTPSASPEPTPPASPESSDSPERTPSASPEPEPLDDAPPPAPFDEELMLTREQKCAQYAHISYKALLGFEGSFMGDSFRGIAPESRALCEALLTTGQTYPTNSLFRDDLFEQTCRSVQDGNEDRVLRDITPLIVPSAEILAARGVLGLRCLIESSNETWDNVIPLTNTSVQPDYSVGFRREAFSDSELSKIGPFLNIFLSQDLSFFRSTDDMYFPFLTAEVKCGPRGLEVADCQNAHSTTLGARAVVELFRLAGRAETLSRQTLTFCISHDERSVRIHACYPVMEGDETAFFRHTLREFSFTAHGGAERWAAYRFVKNLYEAWVPEHLRRIRAAIRDLPSLNELGVTRRSMRDFGFARNWGAA